MTITPPSPQFPSSTQWLQSSPAATQPQSPLNPPSSPHPLLGCPTQPHPSQPLSPLFSPSIHDPSYGTRPQLRRHIIVLVCRHLAVSFAILVVCFYAFVSLQIRFLHTPYTDMGWTDELTPASVREGVAVEAVQPLDEQWLQGQRVVICGLLRDKEEQVVYLQRTLPRITSLFADWALVIVENNSTDSTRERLLAWQQSDTSRVHVLGWSEHAAEPTAASTEPPVSMYRTVRHDYTEQRIRKMVALRNTYMAYVSSHPTLSSYELLVVMDLDLLSFLYTDGLLSTAHHLRTDPSIAAIAANGLLLTTAPLTLSLLRGFEYQDPYAHEDASDPGKRYPQQLDNIRSKFVNRFHYGAPLHAVRSAFGGFAVYRMERVVGKRYFVSWTDGGRQVLCEHVSLHRQLAGGGSNVTDGDGGRDGGGVYLNPTMIHVILDNTDGHVDRSHIPSPSSSTTHTSTISAVEEDTLVIASGR